MSVAVSSWVKYIAGQVPLCPNPVIKDYLIDILRDFCKETNLWDENQLTAIDLVADQADYTLTSSSGDIVSVESVEIDGVPIKPASKKILNEIRYRFRDVTERRPRAYDFKASNVLTLIYTPSEDLTGGLVVWVSLKPLESATSIEDFLWRDYKMDITNGVVGQLLQLSNKPWSDFEKGVVKFNLYSSARDNAKNVKYQGRTNGVMVAPQEFFC
jgi:hypothetical protein